MKAHDYRLWKEVLIVGMFSSLPSVMAYLLIKLLQYLAKQDGLQMSVASLITALEGVREVFMIYSDNTAERNLEDLPPLQKQLLHKFGVMDTT